MSNLPNNTKQDDLRKEIQEILDYEGDRIHHNTMDNLIHLVAHAQLTTLIKEILEDVERENYSLLLELWQQFPSDGEFTTLLDDLAKGKTDVRNALKDYKKGLGL